MFFQVTRWNNRFHHQKKKNPLELCHLKYASCSMILAWTGDERNTFLPAKTNSCIIKNIVGIVQKSSQITIVKKYLICCFFLIQ